MKQEAVVLVTSPYNCWVERVLYMEEYTYRISLNIPQGIINFKQGNDPGNIQGAGIINFNTEANQIDV